jgi:hypothetical protein
MMAENLPEKEKRSSLEVVARFANHPPKIKLVTSLRVFPMTIYISLYF